MCAALVRADTANGMMLEKLISHCTGKDVIYSSRIQILVSKIGRSSKPSPRFLVVVIIKILDCS